MIPADAPTEPILKDLRRTAEGVEIDIFLPRDLFYFQGHFPGHPILPGVAQIEWAVRLADRHLGLDIGSAREFQVKFRAVIQPEENLTLVLRHSSDDRHLRFEFRGKQGVRSSGSIAVPPSSGRPNPAGQAENA